ncbi:MAG TPA: sodium:solute symporter [Candidatus Nanoarchaeia archaeon]|nr:sodium:solute symporter [Candidatus Nanoarchaeia archaeon]
MDYGIWIIIGTAVIFTVIGLLHSRGKKFSLSDYVVSRNSLSQAALVGTLVASAMGAWILFSPAEAAITGGMVAVIGYGFGSAFAVMIFAWLGRKLRMRMPMGHTISEYAYLRYGKGMYLLVILITIFYMSVYLAAELTGIALAAEIVFGIPLAITAVVIGVGTVLYTTVGGLKATVFTDRVQFWFILPLLVIIFAASLYFVGGFAQILSVAQDAVPELFSITFPGGLAFAASLIIAIVGAELFNQANWQRAFAAKDAATMAKGFLKAGWIVFPIIIVAGIFGIFAIGTGQAENPSVAMLTFLGHSPTWITILAMILAVALVMSSIDSLLNGLASLFAVDLVRLKPNLKKTNVLVVGRCFTVVLAGLAILVAIQGWSVLYLFLVADLVCAAAAFPTFFGMFAQKYSGKTALLSSLAGIVAGAFIFPDPSYSRGSLLWSFVVALAVPCVLSLLFQAHGRPYPFGHLKEKVTVLE